MKSTQWKCPKCKTLVIIKATFEADEEFGDTIEVKVACPICKDTRYDSIDQWQYDFSKLVGKIGT